MRVRLGERVKTALQRAVSYGFGLAESGYKQANQADVCIVDFFREKIIESVGNFNVFAAVIGIPRRKNVYLTLKY